MPLDTRLNFIVLAGPNGSGKSTFFARHLAKWNLPFVNPDEIAKELGLSDPAQAAGEINNAASSAAKVIWVSGP